MTEAIELRRASALDADILLGWRNDPDTRAASHTWAIVSLEQHVAWLEAILKNPNRDLYVAEIGGTPIGTVRADRQGDVSELSWTVAPEWRRKGLGRKMVEALAWRIPGQVRAEVKVGNLPSIRIAEACGMRLSHELDGVLHFHRDGPGVKD